MVAAPAIPGLKREPDEQRMLLHGVTWKEYVILRELMDRPGLRMTYLEGALELMSPSPEHELWKTNIARLIELYAHIKRIDLYGYGSATFKKEAKERGAEPDECYLIDKELKDFPEIVLEVIHTSPLLNKLDVYTPASGLRRCGSSRTARSRSTPSIQRIVATVRSNAVRSCLHSTLPSSRVTRCEPIRHGPCASSKPSFAADKIVREQFQGLQ